MKQILFLLAAITLPAAGLTAKEYKLPKEEPVFSLKFPDKWKVTYEDESVDGLSEDEAVEIYAQTDDASTIEASAEASIKYLEEQGVKIDPETEHKTEGKHNGMKMGTIGWSGTDEDGACSVTLLFINVDDETTMTLIYWATDSEVKKHEKAINGVLDSMKSLKAKPKAKKKPKSADDDKEDTKKEAADEKEE